MAGLVFTKKKENQDSVYITDLLVKTNIVSLHVSGWFPFKELLFSQFKYIYQALPNYFFLFFFI